MDKSPAEIARSGRALRWVIYAQLAGVVCATLPSRLDAIISYDAAARHREILTAAMLLMMPIGVLTLFFCPIAVLCILIKRRGQISKRDLIGTIGLEVLLIIAQHIALLPAVQ
jgi:hypothetical protein